MSYSNQPLKNNLISNYTYAILTKNFREFGSQVIINEFSQVIGIITLNFFSLNKTIEIQDIINNKIIKIEREKKPFYKNQVLRDKTNNEMGIIKKKRFFSLILKINVKDKSRKRKYISVGDFKNYNYKINNVSDNKTVAMVKDFSEKNSIAQNLNINLKNHFYIEFFNSNINKFLIISLVISINKKVSKVNSLSNITGLTRRIARLRPIGPGKSFN